MTQAAPVEVYVDHARGKRAGAQVDRPAKRLAGQGRAGASLTSPAAAAATKCRPARRPGGARPCIVRRPPYQEHCTVALPSLARIPPRRTPSSASARLPRRPAAREDQSRRRRVRRRHRDDAGPPDRVEAEGRLLAAVRRAYRPIDGPASGRRARPRLQRRTRGGAIRAVRHRPDTGRHGRFASRADFLVQTGGRAHDLAERADLAEPPAAVPLAGFGIRTYPYSRPSGRRIDAERLLAALRTSPGDVVLLHGSCHNPIGVDPVAGAWRKIGDLVEDAATACRSSISPTRASATGCARTPTGWSGSPARRSSSSFASSFSKNFALYNERVGALTIVADDPAPGRVRAQPPQGLDPLELLEPAGPRRRHRRDDPRRSRPAAPVGGRAGRHAQPDPGEPRRARRGAQRRAASPATGSRSRPAREFALLGLEPEQVARLRENMPCTWWAAAGSTWPASRRPPSAPSRTRSGPSSPAESRRAGSGAPGPGRRPVGRAAHAVPSGYADHRCRTPAKRRAQCRRTRCLGQPRARQRSGRLRGRASGGARARAGRHLEGRDLAEPRPDARGRRGRPTARAWRRALPRGGSPASRSCSSGAPAGRSRGASMPSTDPARDARPHAAGNGSRR